jgi:formate-nitrite transporter family protein
MNLRPDEKNTPDEQEQAEATDRRKSQQKDQEGDSAQDERKQNEEHEEVVDKSMPGAHIVYRAVLKEAEEELERPSVALACSGLAAGLCMGFSLVLDGLLQSRLPDAPWRDLIGKIGYTTGFIILIFGRQQLFTENTLTPILALLKRQDATTLLHTARMWGILLLANLLGGLIIAFVLSRSDVFKEEEKAAFLRIASEAMEPGRMTLFLKSIFAGWLIATMVWMLPTAEHARFSVLVLIPYIVGLGGLSHIIIGSIYSFYTVFEHHHTFIEYFSHFFWPVLLGNCIGGVTLVAVLNYGQAVFGHDDRGSGAAGESD